MKNVLIDSVRKVHDFANDQPCRHGVPPHTFQSAVSSHTDN